MIFLKNDEEAVEINHTFKKGINMTDSIHYPLIKLRVTGEYVVIFSFQNADGERYINT